MKSFLLLYLFLSYYYYVRVDYLTYEINWIFYEKEYKNKLLFIYIYKI